MDDPVVKQVHKMCSTIEALGQELQEERAKNERLEEENETLRWDFNEAMRQYNAQQKRACDAEAENKRLREALGGIFTVANVNHGYPYAQIETLCRAALTGPADE